jgi:hypothetical protein
MAEYNKQFLEACKDGQLEEAKRLVRDYQIDVHADHEIAFLRACSKGQIDTAKWLIYDHSVNVHIDNDLAFRWACSNGRIDTAKWLIKDYQANVHTNIFSAFIEACTYGHIEIVKWLIKDHQMDVSNGCAFKAAFENKQTKILKWFLEEYRYSDSPYYYHNQTAYILNHEPLQKWQSCTILGCPIVYSGELDEPAVIAYMATLKKPKSARS